jgi:cytochrome c biogenesis protein CcmG, thiol:disulfide interchange protein DsbE
MIGRLLPILIFVLLGVLLAAGLKIADHKTEIPSPLIGKPLPPFELPVLGQPDRIMTNADLIGEPFLLNVWASWCPTCRFEHPHITDLAESGQLRVIGFNYRDELPDAQGWLRRFGDPYDLTIQD